MEKPVPQTQTALDYIQCRDYLEDKYDYKERDYGKKHSTGTYNPDAPYLDFWHYVLHNADEISNGAYFHMFDDWADDLEDDDFRKIILKRYFDEFGNGEEIIRFWVEW